MFRLSSTRKHWARERLVLDSQAYRRTTHSVRRWHCFEYIAHSWLFKVWRCTATVVWYDYERCGTSRQECELTVKTSQRLVTRIFCVLLIPYNRLKPNLWAQTAIKHTNRVVKANGDNQHVINRTCWHTFDINRRNTYACSCKRMCSMKNEYQVQK